jgi:Predicted amidohydrolase
MEAGLRISMVQTSILWENKGGNLSAFEKQLARLKGRTDIAVLPETFTTGFSVNIAALADNMAGDTITAVKSWAKKYGFAITGSLFAEDNGLFFNRAFFVTPEGDIYTYDKRHLFRMGNEHKIFSAGEKLTIVRYKDWNICLQICYDLRFPVWSRNVNNAYDLLIYMANWPDPRINVWNTLLPARAIENCCYVCGVNRVGTDGMGLVYSGCSSIYDPKGDRIAHAPKNKIMTRTCVLDKGSLDRFREKFPVWKDADSFQII